MKSMLCTLLLITTISVYAQNTPPMQQAVAMLVNYNDKVHQAVQNVINCFRTDQTCPQIIKQARIINGLVGAALKTLEIETTPMPMDRKGVKKFHRS